MGQACRSGNRMKLKTLQSLYVMWLELLQVCVSVWNLKINKKRSISPTFADVNYSKLTIFMSHEFKDTETHNHEHNISTHGTKVNFHLYCLAQEWFWMQYKWIFFKSVMIFLFYHVFARSGVVLDAVQVDFF